MKMINEEMAVLMTLDMLNDVNEDIKINGMIFEPGYVLQNTDPVAFRQEMLNYMNDIGYEVI
jgi:hypothetical protein